MKKIFSLTGLTLFAIFLFIILKTDFPTIPSLKEKIIICKTQSVFGWQILKLQNEAIISCQDSISLDILYHTKSLDIKFKTNQPFKIMASLRYKGSEVISTDTLEVKPQTDSTTNVLSFALDKSTSPKLNKLGNNDVNEIIFIITDLTDPKTLKLSIDEISLN